MAERRLRYRVYRLFEEGGSTRASRAVSGLFVALILTNVLAAIFESVPRIAAARPALFFTIETLSLVVFTVEYMLRVWVAPEHAPYGSDTPFGARMRYVFSPSGLVDLLAILPLWVSYFTPSDLRVLTVLRVLRFLKLARYSSGMQSLFEALHSERRALFGCAVILFGVTLVAASAIHLAEAEAQPTKFGTIPDSMWWAIVTLGTVGYGDAVPVTPIGRIIASLTIFGGLIMIGLPVGIVAAAFSEEVHRHDFLITWSMVARVPLFSELSAGEVGSVMKLLSAQNIEAGEIITSRGDPATSMYLIADGEVELRFPTEVVRLGQGHFFGEIAVLRHSLRAATAIAVRRSRLLVLDARDLHLLMEREPRVAQRINEAVEKRLAREVVTPSGDVVTEEIAEDNPEDSPGQA